MSVLAWNGHVGQQLVCLSVTAGQMLRTGPIIPTQTRGGDVGGVSLKGHPVGVVALLDSDPVLNQLYFLL